MYRIAFSASDGKGGTCTGTVNVSVPHDQSGKPAVDSGGCGWGASPGEDAAHTPWVRGGRVATVDVG